METLDLQGKRTMIRLDLNVPIKDGMVTSDARIMAMILASLVTIPSLIGTLRSNRIMVRFPCKSSVSILGICIRCLNHSALTNASVVSSMRFEKPHSLSYQEHTFTKVPSCTFVIVASYVEDAGLWLKSIDTNGPSL